MKTASLYIAMTFMVTSFAFLMGGCTRQTVADVDSRMPIVWPVAPEKPRIQFIQAITYPEDLNIRAGMVKRFLGYLGGQARPRIGHPYGIETDDQGRLYVVDSFIKTVHVFDTRRNGYHRFSTAQHPLTAPIDLAIDPDSGFIFLTDSAEGRIVMFSQQGKVYADEFGTGELERPTGIAINPTTAELLVVDTTRARVFRYDLQTRTLKGQFGEAGDHPGALHYPTHICVASNGNIVVSDSLNFRVQIFTSAGQFVRQLGSLGTRSGTFSRPKGVATDSDGNIYVVDGLFDNVQVFDSRGRLLLAFGGHGKEYGEFWLPSGLFIDKEDMIYVSDSYNKRVQVFRYLKEGRS